MRTAKARRRRSWISGLLVSSALFLAADARGQAIYDYTGYDGGFDGEETRFLVGAGASFLF